MFDLILSPAIGAIVGVLTAIWVENLRRPRLSLSVGDTPQDFPQPKGTPAQILRPARLKVTNDRGPRWMTRDPALQCRAEITFRHLDGQKVFAKSMDDNQIRLQMLDPTRITLVSRIDIHAGESQQLDVAARLDNDSECYGWNNETYFHNWRNADWKLPSGRYLVEVTVTSSGQQWNGLFRLVNDVARSAFRLEPALQEDPAKIR